MTITEETVELKTLTGPMRVRVFRPAAAGKYPGLMLFSEIFQITGPISRTGAYLAGNGYVVAVPEIYHELVPVGTVLAYDQAGGEKGNALKSAKEVPSYDADARATLDYLKSLDYCSGRLGVMGICTGGHLAFRAAMNPDVLATACFYATDLHNHALGKGLADNSLDRAGDIKGELLMFWGRQDPHVPLEGRILIHARLEEVGANYQWIEVNGQHAFLRDEGARYDPALSRSCYGFVFELFHRCLAGCP
jgi:carboxymethylenebutenolidase